MFDISLGELVVILIVMLVVLGPQKATETAKNIGRFISKIKTMAQNISSEFNTQIKPIQETYEELHNVEKQIHSHFLDTDNQQHIPKRNRKPIRPKNKILIKKIKLKKNIKRQY